MSMLNQNKEMVDKIFDSLINRRVNIIRPSSFQFKQLGHPIKKTLDIRKIIFNYPATIVFWKDGTKTIVKHGKHDIEDKEKAVLWCYLIKHVNMTKSQIKKQLKLLMNEK